MEYNTAKTRLRFPEYGRCVQEMIDTAKALPDPAERQATVEAVVRLMHQMHPANKGQEDFREKIWKHIFAMADYHLDVTPPPGIDISPEARQVRPGPVSYPPTTRRMRHYGYNVGSLIKKCIEMPEGPKKDAFTETIAAYMKLAYKTWNREHFVSDEVVKDDLITLSDGLLRLENHGSLDILANQLGLADLRGGSASKGSRGGRSRGGRSRGGGGNGNGGNGNGGNNMGGVGRGRRRK